MDEQKKEAPKCNLVWEGNHYVVECETPADRDVAAKALEEEEIVVRVKVKKETQDKK